jgi:(S)-mandelate dehydrogenase
MKPPVSATVRDYHDIMRNYLPRLVYDYVMGGAESERCMARNCEELDALTLAPRVLRDMSNLDTSTQILGSTWRRPFAIAPTGDAALAIAATAHGIPFVLSTASNQHLEDIRRAVPNGDLWLQLYMMKDRAIARQLIVRAKHAGYGALMLTVDVPIGGTRRRDIRNRFGLPLRRSPRLLLDLITHPRWAMRMARSGAPVFANLIADASSAQTPQAAASLLARDMDLSLDWNAIGWLRSIWDGPLLLKGILHPDDALLAVQHGLDGLVVSNHGGRQFDAAPSAIAALADVAEAVQGKLQVFMDSGIRGGADICKALSLGAKGVFVGRPVLYGLAADGEAGVRAVLSILADELERNMILLGISNIEAFGNLRSDVGGRFHTETPLLPEERRQPRTAAAPA